MKSAFLWVSFKTGDHYLPTPNPLTYLKYFFFFKKRTGASQFQINSLAFLRPKTITCKRIILELKVHWASGGLSYRNRQRLSNERESHPCCVLLSPISQRERYTLRNLEAGSHLAGGTIVKMPPSKICLVYLNQKANKEKESDSNSYLLGSL